MEYPVFPLIHKPTKILGITIEELFAVVAMLVLFMVIAIVASLFMVVPMLYFPICTVIVLIVFMILRRAGREKHPNYVLSYISYHFLQPWVVEPSKVEMKTLSYYKELYSKLKDKIDDQQQKN